MRDWGNTEQHFASDRLVPAAARLSTTLMNCFAPSPAFKPLLPALFLIISGQTELQPVVWLPVCLTLCGWEGVTVAHRLGQSSALQLCSDNQPAHCCLSAAEEPRQLLQPCDGPVHPARPLPGHVAHGSVMMPRCHWCMQCHPA